MTEYDLRTLFPLKDVTFQTSSGEWLCRLAEVSDLRPQADRLSWYLVFERDSNEANDRPSGVRKLEIVTSAKQVLEHGFGNDLRERLQRWLDGNQDEARVEWLRG
jgi:hypothetical protein